MLAIYYKIRLGQMYNIHSKHTNVLYCMGKVQKV